MGSVMVSLVFALLTAPRMELQSLLLSVCGTALQSVADPMTGLEQSFARGA